MSTYAHSTWSSTSGKTPGTQWLPDANKGLRSLRPAHTGRVCRRVLEHKLGLIRLLWGRWDEDLETIRREGSRMKPAPLFTRSPLTFVTSLQSMAHDRIATEHEAKGLKIL
ncbi:hypothetical protein BH24ACT19_BH24ACT19_05870 [soil metagenome]